MNMAATCLDKPPSQTAIIDLSAGARVDISYGELDDMTNRIAHALRARVSEGDRIGVLLGQTPWCAAAHLAIWKIGAISVPLFKLFKKDALTTRINDAGCDIVLTDEEGADQLGGIAQAWIVSDLPDERKRVDVTHCTQTTPAVLIYTSGTTGKPKGALHGHGVLEGHLPGVSLSHDTLGAPDDVLWTPADWAWIGGLFDVLMPALRLGIPVVAARMNKFTPDACQNIVAKAKVRNVFFPPTALRMLKASGTQIEGLRSVASGGEPLGAEMLDWGRSALNVTINEFYGQTECNMVISSCSSRFPPRAGCMGKPVPGFDIEVIDENGKPTTGEGEIAIRRGAPSMMLEYWNRPDATAQKYVGEWMLTGDRGTWDEGYIRFVGREDDVITSAGYRIGPAEIEDCLLTHPCVATVGVVGKPDPLRTEIVKAYVVPNTDQKPEGISDDALAETLKAYVKERLSTYSYPREIELLSELPMTVTGKVIRKDLKARATREAALETGETE